MTIDKESARKILEEIEGRIVNSLADLVGSKNDSVSREKVKHRINQQYIANLVKERKVQSPVKVVCDERNNTPESKAKGQLIVGFMDAEGNWLSLQEVQDKLRFD